MVVIEEIDDITPEEEESTNLKLSYDPEKCLKVTPDGGVLLEVIEEGEGEKPCLHAKCLVHYVGLLMENGSVFMDTKEEAEGGQPTVLIAGRTQGPRDVGLCQAVSYLRPGGHGRIFVVDPKYGYGSIGSFSFPCVPGNSSLVYDLHLLHWEPPSENEEEKGSLLYEERLERAERRRLAGNEFFKQGDMKAAMGKYSMALSYLDEEFFYQLEGHYLTKAERSKAAVHLNLAACQLRLGDWNTCVYNCTQALSQGDPDSKPFRVKVLYRRAKARHQLGQSEEALKDLEEALKLEPKNPEVVEELNAVRTTLRKERAASAALFKGKLKFASPDLNEDASKNSDSVAEGAGKVDQEDSSPEGLSVGSAKERKKSKKNSSRKKVDFSNSEVPASRGLRGMLALFISYVAFLLRALFSRKPVIRRREKI